MFPLPVQLQMHSGILDGNMQMTSSASKLPGDIILRFENAAALEEHVLVRALRLKARKGMSEGPAASQSAPLQKREMHTSARQVLALLTTF